MLKGSLVLSIVVLLASLATPALADEPPPSNAIDPWDGPVVRGKYNVQCSIKVYDWTCNKVLVLNEAVWEIEQGYDEIGELERYYNPKIQCTFTLKGIPREWGFDATDLQLFSDKGYVGPFVRNPEGRITNKPRLSQSGSIGAFCYYSKYAGTWKEKWYGTWTINAKVNWDKKTGKVKSIKGDIHGWGELGLPPIDTYNHGEGFARYIPRFGQFEGKFTATPVD